MVLSVKSSHCIRLSAHSSWPNQKERLMQKKLNAGLLVDNTWDEAPEKEVKVDLGGYKKKDEAEVFFQGKKKHASPDVDLRHGL